MTVLRAIKALALAWLLTSLNSFANGTVTTDTGAADPAAIKPPSVAEAIAVEELPEAEPAAEAAKPAWLQPAPFLVDYRLKFAGLSADFTLQLEQQNESDYVVKATTQTRGLAKLLRGGAMREEARFSSDGERLYSSSYVVEGGSKSSDDDSDIRFDWQGGSAASIYEEEPATLPLQGEVYDRISADIVIINDLRNGRQPRSLRIAEKNQLRDYEFTYEGEETVEVPAGTFATVKYMRRRIGSSRSTRIWYAPAADYLPVRMEQLKRGETSATSVATRITR